MIFEILCVCVCAGFVYTIGICLPERKVRMTLYDLNKYLPLDGRKDVEPLLKYNYIRKIQEKEHSSESRLAVRRIFRDGRSTKH